MNHPRRYSSSAFELGHTDEVDRDRDDILLDGEPGARCEEVLLEQPLYETCAEVFPERVPRPSYDARRVLITSTSSGCTRRCSPLHQRRDTARSSSAHEAPRHRVHLLGRVEPWFDGDDPSRTVRLDRRISGRR